MKSSDFASHRHRHDLLQQQRARNIASSIVKVGSTSMQLYHANPQLFPQNRNVVVDPSQQIVRGRETWNILAPRDPDPGFLPRHVITDQEICDYWDVNKKG